MSKYVFGSDCNTRERFQEVMNKREKVAKYLHRKYSKWGRDTFSPHFTGYPTIEDALLRSEQCRP